MSTCPIQIYFATSLVSEVYYPKQKLKYTLDTDDSKIIIHCLISEFQSNIYFSKQCNWICNIMITADLLDNFMYAFFSEVMGSRTDRP